MVSQLRHATTLRLEACELCDSRLYHVPAMPRQVVPFEVVHRLAGGTLDMFWSSWRNLALTAAPPRFVERPARFADEAQHPGDDLSL